MKNLLKVNGEDNIFTAFAKGGVIGMIITAVPVGTAAIIGTALKAKNGNSGIEEFVNTIEESIEE